MPRYEDDDDDDRPSRRSRRGFDDDENDAPRKPRSKKAPEGNGFALTSMILGLVGFCVPVICGLLAMLFGLFGLNRAKVTGTGKGMAIAGIILGLFNGLLLPAVGGYGFYYSMKKTREAVLKKQADAEADLKKWQEEEQIRQKKWADDQKAMAMKSAEDAKKRDEAQKLAAAKYEQERLKREAERKAIDEELAQKREEDRLKREMETKERMAKAEEERKKRDEENKLVAEVNTARQQIFVLENACRSYTIRNKNKPPATLQALLTPPGGGVPLIAANTPMKDPWGQDYQYDPANKNQVGGLDPLVFTFHPKTGEKILAFNRK